MQEFFKNGMFRLWLGTKPIVAVYKAEYTEVCNFFLKTRVGVANHCTSNIHIIKA